MRRLLEKIVLAASLLFSAPSVATEPATLYVNPAPTHYTMERSQKDGEKDILSLTAPEDDEENWIYVQYEDGREMWHENGDYGHNSEVYFDTNVLDDVLEDADRIKSMSLYHNHPRVAAGKAQIADDSQIPSYDDIRTDLNVLEHVYARVPKLLSKIDIRVVVSTGTYVLKYSPRIVLIDDEMRSKYLRQRGIMDMEYNKLGYSSNKQDIDYTFENKGNYAEENRKYAKKYSNDAFSIEFVGAE